MLRLLAPVLFLLTLFSCDRSTKEHAVHILDFGSFTITTPIGWTKVEVKGVDSYVGGILLDSFNIISFDLGRYSDDLNEYDSVTLNGKTYYINNADTGFSPKLYDSINIDKVKLSRVEWTQIDNRHAKLLIPITPGKGRIGVYIDSLWFLGNDIIEFQLSGRNIAPHYQQEVLNAFKTLKFKRIE